MTTNTNTNNTNYQSSLTSRRAAIKALEHTLAKYRSHQRSIAEAELELNPLSKLSYYYDLAMCLDRGGLEAMLRALNSMATIRSVPTNAATYIRNPLVAFLTAQLEILTYERQFSQLLAKEFLLELVHDEVISLAEAATDEANSTANKD